MAQCMLSTSCVWLHIGLSYTYIYRHHVLNNFVPEGEEEDGKGRSYCCWLRPSTTIEEAQSA